MARLAAGLEGLDDEHATATARAGLGEHLRRRRINLDRFCIAFPRADWRQG